MLSTVTTQANANSTIVDFFLQAHAAIQGTAKPSHYVVILDEMKLGADELQTITHHLSCKYIRVSPSLLNQTLSLKTCLGSGHSPSDLL